MVALRVPWVDNRGVSSAPPDPMMDSHNRDLGWCWAARTKGKDVGTP